ncbi:MAG: prolyl oligopeptidase family serine peptidase [Candidatus Aminicenantes bacterium]|nr:prolyl oligopeptidase family serine peptidase [Candidatus Aminicenantes bacterium]
MRIKVLFALCCVVCCAMGFTRAPARSDDVQSVQPPAAQVDEMLFSPPRTEKRPVVDLYHGVSVTDDYRWLEKGDAAEVQAWSAAENAYARRSLDSAPNRAEIAKKLKALMGYESPDWYALNCCCGRLFALKSNPPKQQPFLVVMQSAAAPETERVILDPNALDAMGGTAIDWYEPSPDGKLVAVSLSTGGSERGNLHVYNVDSGAERAIDAVPRVNGGTAGGSLAWLGDGTGFFYTRYPAPGERPAEDLDFFQEVWFHRLGADPKLDMPSLQKGLPRIAEIQLKASTDGSWILARVSNGDGGEYDHWIVAPGKTPEKSLGQWRKVASLADKVIRVDFSPDGKLWLLSRKNAPNGKLLELDPQADLAKAKTMIPESDVVISQFVVTQSRIYTADLIGGPYQARVFARNGKALHSIDLPLHSSIWSILALGSDDVLLYTESYTEPPAWKLYHAADKTLTVTALAKKPATNFDDAEVVRETCVSTDGTKVPLNILRKKGTKRDGSNKFLLYGYGGYSISLSPYFDASLRVWLDEGGIFAWANIRGGGEFGEVWHLAGNLTNKQNVFDDFLACARHVIEAGYTKPERLAVIGASNGGLLMGAALTQAPELFRAVVSLVGIYDMLRVEFTPNGAFNVTEFGTVKDKAQFDAMFAYSPYHRVVDGTAYPAVLFMTGANDPRVDPYNSRKMTARLQAATSSGRPILLRTSGSTGHGIGTPLDEQVEEQVDIWSFLLRELAGPR